MYTEKQIEDELVKTFENGHYNKRTTFDSDFMIANMFGKSAIIDTFDRVFREWRNDIVYLTELALVTNAYCWSYYYKEDKVYSELYAEYYYKCRDYAYSDAFNEAEQRYYFQCTD